MISILIVDDDLNKISTIIASILEVYKDEVEVKQASSVQEALEVLKSFHFHLLISDLYMPLRVNEAPEEKGGEILIKEIYKTKNKVNTPIYIIGLTQFENIRQSFSGVWQVWNYTTDNNEWKIKLRDLIFHISKINSKIAGEKKETLFVEGVTDKELLLMAMKIFFKEHQNSISIETVKYGGGAHWVERQLIIWGKTLFRKQDGSYMQAIGLFDNDQAGKSALESLRKYIPNDSAENKTFSTLSLDCKYAKHLLPSYKGGIRIPITIEEMMSPLCWHYAAKKKWLKPRKLSEEMLSDPQKWDKTNQSLSDYVNSLGLDDEVTMYLKHKIDDDHKLSIMNYVKSLNNEKQQEALISFKPLIELILEKINIKLAPMP